MLLFSLQQPNRTFHILPQPPQQKQKAYTMSSILYIESLEKIHKYAQLAQQRHCVYRIDVPTTERCRMFMMCAIPYPRPGIAPHHGYGRFVRFKEAIPHIYTKVWRLHHKWNGNFVRFHLRDIGLIARNLFVCSRSTLQRPNETCKVFVWLILV